MIKELRKILPCYTEPLFGCVSTARKAPELYAYSKQQKCPQALGHKSLSFLVEQSRLLIRRRFLHQIYVTPIEALNEILVISRILPHITCRINGTGAPKGAPRISNGAALHDGASKAGSLLMFIVYKLPLKMVCMIYVLSSALVGVLRCLFAGYLNHSFFSGFSEK